MLTNDKNLESKAIVSNMEASSKERFQNKYLSFSAEKTLSCDNSVSKENNDNLMCIDNTYCELKNTLKEFLSLVRVKYTKKVKIRKYLLINH